MADDGRRTEEEFPAEDVNDLYENAPCGYLSVRPDGKIYKVNATFARWIGWTPAQMVGMRLHTLLNVAGRIFYETHFAPLLRMQGFFNEVALDMVTAEGKALPVFVNAAERRDSEGRHLFTRLTVFNATDRRRYEHELIEARAAAEAARTQLEELNIVMRASLMNERETSALREQFIAVLGHDLRNPLTAISGGLEMLLRTPLNEKAKDLVAMTQACTNRMGGLISDVMDFARGRLGGGITLDRNADEPLDPVLRRVIAELQAADPERLFEIDISISAAVDCDRRRVGQLASNLLGNALTHGAADTPIHVGAFTKDGWFEFYVANAGEQISPAVMKNIFEPFSRGTHRPSPQGLGLGLYISHSIAQAHGGTLGVVSTATETRFTFRMPLVPSHFLPTPLKRE